MGETENETSHALLGAGCLTHPPPLVSSPQESPPCTGKHTKLSSRGTLNLCSHEVLESPCHLGKAGVGNHSSQLVRRSPTRQEGFGRADEQDEEKQHSYLIHFKMGK